MSFYLSIFLILLTIVLFLRSKKSALIYFYVFAVTNSALQFDIGVAFKVYHIIVILMIPRIVKFYRQSFQIRNITKPLVLEYCLMLFLGIIFGFILKFKDPYEEFRMFTQRAEMRSIISSFRIFIELFSILLFAYWFAMKRLNFELLIRILSTIVIINLLIAIFFYINSNEIFQYLFPNDRIAYNYGRFNGLGGEPRAFGRTNAFILLILLFVTTGSSYKIRLYGIICSLIGVLLSMSASAYIVCLIGLLIYAIYQNIKFSLYISIIILIVYNVVISSNEKFHSTNRKIQIVLSNTEDHEKVSSDEPEFFARFELFDRAALNFFYHYPLYVIFGVGPNLISIPASDYVTPYVKNTAIYSYGLNTAPATFLVNTISRTGIIGLILWIIFFIALFRKINKPDFRKLLVALILMNFLTNSNIFFMVVGCLIGLTILPNDPEREKLAI